MQKINNKKKKILDYLIAVRIDTQRKMLFWNHGFRIEFLAQQITYLIGSGHFQLQHYNYVEEQWHRIHILNEESEKDHVARGPNYYQLTFLEPSRPIDFKEHGPSTESNSETKAIAPAVENQVLYPCSKKRRTPHTKSFTFGKSLEDLLYLSQSFSFSSEAFQHTIFEQISLFW